MKNPDATSYLNTYPVAVKLWMEGKLKEAAIAFAKNPCQLIVKGEAKAKHFARERQAVVAQLKAPKHHEAITDAMCRGYRAIWDNWPSDDPISPLCDYPEIKALVDAIEARRNEWRNLFGVYTQAERARQNAIRLKRFVRTMTLLAKNNG